MFCNIGEQILTVAPHMGHARLSKCPTFSPYNPQVRGRGLQLIGALDECVAIFSEVKNT